jgi:hypothetical protein
MLTATRDTDGTLWADTDDHGLSRRLRYTRRARARAIAYTMSPNRQSDDSGPLRRLKGCGLAKQTDVTIKIHNGRAFASGLISCGNIWTCATCSARIEARRCQESEAAYSEHVASGGTFGMLTLTLRHKKDTPLAESLEALNHAWERLQQRRKFQPLYHMLAGTVATVEITYGDNGWHPHLHIILLAGAETTYEQVKEQTDSLRSNWSHLVNSRTNRYTLEHGLNLVWFGKDAATAAKYTHKIAQEMTLSINKSKGPTKHPLELLDRDDEQATALFIEYALATKGRQKHRWSNGLRRALKITTELTDEELADANEDVGEEALIISAQLWNSITDTERLGWLEFVEAQHHFGGP